MLELIEQSLCLINANGVLGPAILGRSLIELTSTFVLNGDAIRRCVAEAATRWDTMIVASEDLENLLNKAVFGSRLVPKDHYLIQTNVLTSVQKLSRISGFEDVVKKYEYLCEVAHPNVVGSRRFWSDWLALEPEGARIRAFNPRTLSNDTVRELEETSLWAIGWSSGNTIAGFHILDEQLGIIGRHFPSESGLGSHVDTTRPVN
jgi:hypothetical protein